MMSTFPTKEEMQLALTKRVGETLQNKLNSSTVAICGLGGLGSNIAISLARTGIGRLILIDFDKVDISNLNRQQYKAEQIGIHKAKALQDNLREISPYIEIKSYVRRLEENNYTELLSDADIICEAFDVAEEKSKLANYVLEQMPDKYFVAASGMAGLGSPNEIITRRITNMFYLCGDGKSDVNGGESLFSARVMLCAAHQATVILRIIAGKYEI